MLRDKGVTVNLTGRWSSGTVTDALTKLAESKSGGTTTLFTTKANAGITKVVKPVNFPSSGNYYYSSAVLQDSSGNTWSVWGNSPDFIELVLLTGNVNTLPVSGELMKLSGTGQDSVQYEEVLSFDTTNPFWDDEIQGNNYIKYVQNWNRPTPNVLVLLWGVNDLTGSDIINGSYTTDHLIDEYVNRLKLLVDPFIRDFNGHVIICPQPAGSEFSSYQNNDRKALVDSNCRSTEKILEWLKSDAIKYSKCYVAPVAAWLDSKFGFNTEQMKIAERIAELNPDYSETIATDATHENQAGYNQMADCVYSIMKNIVNAM